MIAGLGYGLLHQGGQLLYNCNYKGYTWTFPAPAEDYEDKVIKKEVYSEFDSETGNPTGTPTLVDVTIQVMKDTEQSAINVMTYFNSNVKESEAYLCWCNITFLGKEAGLIKEAVKNDIYGNPIGKQWDFENSFYAYEDETTLKKRSVVWADLNLSEAQVNGMITARKYDIKATTKVGKLEEVIEKYGVSQGFLKQIKETPDGKMAVEL